MKKSVCASCGAEIYWAITEKGARIPVDVRPDDRGNLGLELNGVTTIARVIPRDVELFPVARYFSHFATCPSAGMHRKRPRSARV